MTVFEGPEFDGNAPVIIGEVDVEDDREAIAVTVQTKNTEATQVHVSITSEQLYIELGDGQRSIRRTVSLSGAIHEELAVATFRNGIIDIVVPKRKS